MSKRRREDSLPSRHPQRGRPSGGFIDENDVVVKMEVARQPSLISNPSTSIPPAQQSRASAPSSDETTAILRDADQSARSTRRQFQLDLMSEIELAWKRCRRVDKQDGEEFKECCKKAETILLAYRTAIEQSQCDHDGIILCFKCAKDMKQHFDASLLRENRPNGYKLLDRSENYRDLVAARLRSARFAEGAPGREFYIMTNDFTNLAVDIHLTGRIAIVEKLLSDPDQLSNTESARVFWDGESPLPGMKIDAPKVLEAHKIVDSSHEFVILHPTFYSLACPDGMSNSCIYACMEGAVAMMIWHGSDANVTRSALALLGEGQEHAFGTEGLLAPYLLFLQVGDLVVLPPTTIYSMVSIEASILLLWRAIPVQMLDGSCQGMVFNRMHITHKETRGDKACEEGFEEVLVEDLKVWHAFQALHCAPHGDEDATKAERIIEKLKNFSLSPAKTV